MPNTEPENDIATLRAAAQTLQKLPHVDIEGLALASRFESTATALEAGTMVVNTAALVQVALYVLKQHGPASSGDAR